MSWFKTAAIFFLALVVAACATSRPAQEPRVEANRLTFALPDLTGREISSSDELFAGKVVLVTLWGTWCPPCVSEIPTFNDLQYHLKDEGLVVVAIAFEKDSDTTARRQHLREFASQHEIDYLVLDGGSIVDFSTALPMVDDVEGFPVEILIDRHGVVADVRNGYGFSEKWARGLENRLQDLLSP